MCSGPVAQWIFILGGSWVGWTVLSALWAPSTYWALHSAASWVIYLVYLWLLRDAFRNPAFRNLFLGGLFLILSIWSLIQIGGYFADGYRMSTLFGVHPLLSAELLVALAPLSIGLFLFHPVKGWRMAGLLSFFLFYWSLLQTGKRSPFIGLICGLIFALAVLLRFFFKNRLFQWFSISNASRPMRSGAYTSWMTAATARGR